MADRKGLVKGKDARIRITFTDGNQPVNWTGRVCTGRAKLDGASSDFPVTVTDVGTAAQGKKDVLILGTQLPASSTAKWLRLEFTITGTPVVNSPESPLKVPLRDAYGDGPDR